MKLLAIDIGNTNISFGIFDNNRIIKKFNIPTEKYAIRKLKALLGEIECDDCVICSVVPKATDALKRDCKKFFYIRPYIAGENIILPIKNLYRKPRQLGQDRLVNAYAAAACFGAPVIAIDYGTAVTFDIVSRKKEYLGGMILPGLRLSLEALSRNTALLPEIEIDAPREFIGRDTKNSILSGIVYGFAALTDALVGRIKRHIGKNAHVVATGGDSTLIGNYCKSIDLIDSDLTLKGLNLMYTTLKQAGKYV
jgi:type III pantothenate kinase